MCTNEAYQRSKVWLVQLVLYGHVYVQDTPKRAGLISFCLVSLYSDSEVKSSHPIADTAVGPFLYYHYHVCIMYCGSLHLEFRSGGQFLETCCAEPVFFVHTGRAEHTATNERQVGQHWPSLFITHTLRTVLSGKRSWHISWLNLYYCITR